MSPEEIQERWTAFVVPDIRTVHSKPLYDAIKDLRFLLSLVGEFSKEGKILREENKVLKNELAAVEDALKDAIGRTKA